MVARIVRLPNGHVTASSRISKVRVFPDRSASLERPYVEVYEAGRVVFAGLMALMDITGGAR
ncbi:MAG TPA: hypothetical protein VD978_07170 [Azospirillum sp.]|nr:hypothetical protein [Azospirillum sp.]